MTQCSIRGCVTNFIAQMEDKKMSDIFDEIVRSFIGFDRLRPYFAAGLSRVPSFPPYDVIKESDTKYTIEIALAGYNPEDIDISVENGVLTVSSAKVTDTSDKYVYKGIAKRSFRHSWNIEENMEVVGADMINGVLRIAIVRHIPEAALPKKIPISVSGALEHKPEE